MHRSTREHTKTKDMIATKFIGRTNPFTGESNIKIVPVPDRRTKIKGTTGYDEHFVKLLDFKQAMRVPEDEFQAVRVAIRRFMSNHNINTTCAVRQMKEPATKTYTIWLVNTPPKTRSKP